MASNKQNNPVRRSAGIAGLLLALPAAVCAVTNEFVPRIEVSETYTDNVRLAPDGSEESDLITAVTPGLHISRRAARAELDLDYEVEGLIFADDSDSNTINHKLFTQGNLELKPDWFYFDGSASYAQRNANPTSRRALDTVTGFRDLSDVGTVRLSPYMRHDFSGEVVALARATHEQVINVDNIAGDSEINTVDLNLQSGRHWQVLTWSFSYQNSDEDRDGESDNTFESSRANVSYRLTNTFRLLAQAGYEDNEFQTNRSIENGGYYSAGAFWRPSRYYGAQVLYGDKFKSGSVMLYPTRRSDFEVSWFDRDVGTNLGETWEANLQHRGSHLTLSGSYHEDTTTFQRIELERFTPVLDSSGNVVTDPFGNPVVFLPTDPIVGTTPEGFLTITDELIERQRARAAAVYRTAKSTLRLSAFVEERTLLSSGTGEDTHGGAASWAWRYTGRTESILRGGTQRSDRSNSGQEDDLWFAQWSLVHDLAPDTTGVVELRHTEQDSTNAQNDYTENRLTLRFRMEF